MWEGIVGVEKVWWGWRRSGYKWRRYGRGGEGLGTSGDVW